MFKERWYGSVRMASETVECKFCGGNIYGLAWCMIVPLHKGKGYKYECGNPTGIVC